MGKQEGRRERKLGVEWGTENSGNVEGAGGRMEIMACMGQGGGGHPRKANGANGSNFRALLELAAGSGSRPSTAPLTQLDS